jgi:hypothetical protein
VRGVEDLTLALTAAGADLERRNQTETATITGHYAEVVRAMGDVGVAVPVRYRHLLTSPRINNESGNEHQRGQERAGTGSNGGALASPYAEVAAATADAASAANAAAAADGDDSAAASSRIPQQQQARRADGLDRQHVEPHKDAGGWVRIGDFGKDTAVIAPLLLRIEGVVCNREGVRPTVILEQRRLVPPAVG